MSRALAFACAAVVAAAVESASVWVLTHVIVLRLSFAFAVAFAAGYLALFVAMRLLAPSRANPSLGTQLQAHILFGIAVLLLVEAVVYLCVDLIHLDNKATNAAVLAAVVCWVALGWPFVGGDAFRSPSGSAHAAKHE